MTHDLGNSDATLDRDSRIGLCRLCLNPSANLRQSHYLPKGLYRLLRDEKSPNPNPVLLTERLAVSTSKQLTPYLLCGLCEKRLSHNGENWVLQHCPRRGSFTLATILDAVSPSEVSSCEQAPNIDHLCDASRAKNQQLATPTGVQSRRLFTARTLKLLDCSPISCFNFDMETLSFGIDCAPKDKTPQVTRSPIDQSPAAHLTFHDREHLSTIVNSAPRGAQDCSRSNGNLFMLPWNPCS